MLPISILLIENEDDRGFVADIYARYGTLMLSCAIKILRHEQDAVDAVNTAFIRLIEKLDTLKQIEDTKIKQYVVRTAKHVAINMMIKRQREQNLAFNMEASLLESIFADCHSIENEVIAKVTIEEMIHALGTLPPQERMAMSMRYLDGASDDEIGRQLCIRPSTVRKYLTNGRRHLYKMLGGDANDE